MSDVYRIFGAELSPYSVKVRSYFRYKGIPHEWIVRNSDTMDEYKKVAKLPLIPAVAAPDGSGLQDSTPILEKIEALFPEPSIHPDDPAVAFVSALVEEFGDEWGNKWMFHYRWAREADQRSASERLAAGMMPDASAEQISGIASGLVDRMLGRVWFVGSNDQTSPQIEDGFKEAVRQLDAHLASRPYLFGGRPAFGDFGLWGQIYNAWTDPTPHELMSDAPNLVAWVERMLEPKALSEFESWETLSSSLSPFITRHVGGQFLPWSAANARAIETGSEEFSVELLGQTWTQKPQKYHARSLAAIRAKYAASGGGAALDGILKETNCLAWLREA